MDARPVGVFDSGMGGLTVLHELLVTLPHEDFVYLGDAARLPYGPRPLPEIRLYAQEIGGWLDPLRCPICSPSSRSRSSA
jgi:glutamate racemase